MSQPNETKAAYLAGYYAGLQAAQASTKSQLRAKLAELKPHAHTAQQCAFEGGAFNPMTVWAMLAACDELLEQPPAQGEEVER
jgi:hypothetical protein